MTLLFALGCSSGGAKSDGGADGAGGGSGPPDSCQAARACALDCSDAACLANCASRANPAGQAAFQTLVQCTMTMGQCTSLSDINCMCQAQCLMDPPCIAEVDTCLAGIVQDNVCALCH